MKINHLPLCASALALSVIGLTAPAMAGDLRFAKAPIEGQYIVVLKEQSASLASENGNRPRVSVLASEMARAHGAQLKRSYQSVLRGFVAQADDRALARLLADPRVDYVEEDGVVNATATQSGATWGLDRIDQRDRPLNQSYTYNTGAAGVNAYIVDTGIRGTHTDFGSRVGSGYTAISDGNGTTDCNGHGTHVAGTVGGTTWGVAKQVKLYPVRVLGCDGSGSNSGVIAGMDWVANNHVKPAVANMSLGGGVSSTTDSAVARMVSAGVTVVVAAGNDNDNACNYSPARAASAITVGSTTNTDARSSFSNYGSCLDIFAPGSDIASAWSTSNTATNTISGTSMAAPHVAGVAALYLATNPTATPAQVTSALVAGASSNKVSDVVGSTNKLLYSLLGGGDGGDGDGCTTTGGTLANGTAAGNLCGAANAELRFTMTVPAGATGLSFASSGGTGDADMYVRFGSAPTTSSYDCRPYVGGNNETCTISNVQAGTYHVMLRGYSAFAGLSLKGSYTATGGGDNVPQTYSNTSDYTIRDNATIESPVTVSGRSGFAPAATSVAVDIRHTYKGDLRVDLVAPDGSVYNLHDRAGGSADNVIGTATVNLSSELLNGNWKLRVNDNYTGDTGYINSWSVTF